MNPDKLIRLTNRIALFSVLLLVYWVFIFVSLTIFGFKIFRENITEGFYLSILGIFAVLSGSMIVNIMLNLTKISNHIQKKEAADIPASGTASWGIWIFFASFPVIFIILYAGDLSSSYMKRKSLINFTEVMVSENKELLEKMANYQFTQKYLDDTSRNLALIQQYDESFPEISLIIQDDIDGYPYFLMFEQEYYFYDDEGNSISVLDKTEYIFSVSGEERKYLNEVFNEKTSEYRFSSSDGTYELYYPVKLQGRVIIIYLSEYQNFGKIGS